MLVGMHVVTVLRNGLEALLAQPITLAGLNSIS